MNMWHIQTGVKSKEQWKRNNRWNETRSGCLQRERILMKIWETKCHVWIVTETNRIRILYKYTSFQSASYTQETGQIHRPKATVRQRGRERHREWERETCCYLHPSISPSPVLSPPSITPHVWGMLSWKRLAALCVYKRRRCLFNFSFFLCL